MTKEYLHIAGVVGVTCEVCDWAIERLMQEFVGLLKARHGKGGLTVCRECITRMKVEADRRRGIKS